MRHKLRVFSELLPLPHEIPFNLPMHLLLPKSGMDLLMALVHVIPCNEL